MLQRTVVSAYKSADTGILGGVRYRSVEAAVLNLATAIIHTGNTTQVGMIDGVMVGFNGARHPAVAYRTIVVAGDAAHLPAITQLEIHFNAQVLHHSPLVQLGEDSLIVGGSGGVLDADGVTVAVKRGFKGMTT